MAEFCILLLDYLVILRNEGYYHSKIEIFNTDLITDVRFLWRETCMACSVEDADGRQIGMSSANVWSNRRA